MILKRRICHLTVLNRNLGDNALNLAIRQMLEPFARFRHLQLLNNSFSTRTVRYITGCRALIFGGGGLIHSYGPKGTPWTRTGTMWDMELEDIRKIKGSIILYGVGFNHFFGEPPPLPQMRCLFELLLEKQALIAFRNDGSRERFLEAFPEFTGEGIREIPDPGFFFRVEPHRASRPYIVLQIAADRSELRYEGRFEQLLEFISKICSAIPHDVFMVPHTIDDQRLMDSLRLPFPVTKLTLRVRAKDTGRVMAFYAGAEFSLTIRGHGQICSLGNGTPNFSIVTHPKVAGFAQSSGMEDYCFHLGRQPLSQGEAAFWAFYKTLEEIRRKVDQLQIDFGRRIDDFNLEVEKRIYF